MDSSLIVNFGGPRNLDEVFPFLQELLLDPDVVKTALPRFLHRALFRRVARKRAARLQKEYALMGGRSPIFADTEEIAQSFMYPALTFHRYLPMTHAESLRKIEECQSERILVLPMFPQFTYATTGSIARFFAHRLSQTALQKLRWCASYGDHPLFVEAMQRKIRDFVQGKDVFLLFSAHGVPKQFVEKGDPYERECQASFEAIGRGFPGVDKILAYQSKFGRGEWLRPYTLDLVQDVNAWNPRRKPVVVVPLSFPSDHIETIVEIGHQYVPMIERQGIEASRCPALNLEPYWLEALQTFFKTPSLFQKTTWELFR